MLFRSHPIHSYFETDDVIEKEGTIQPNFHFKDAGFGEGVENKIDTGRWILIQNAVLRSGDTSSKAKENIGKMGGSDTFTLKEENLPPHSHYMKYDDYSITSEQILGALQFPKNIGEGSASGAINTMGDIAWVSMPLLPDSTTLDVTANNKFAYSDLDMPMQFYDINKFVEIGDSMGTVTLPVTKNIKVLVAKSESLAPGGNKDIFTFTGRADLDHTHPFGTVTFVKEKGLNTPKTITVKPSKGHSYGIINDGIQLEGAPGLVRGKAVNNIPHHRLTYIFWRVGKDEVVGEPVYYDRRRTK